MRNGPSVIVIGKLGPNDSDHMAIQDFYINDEKVIPIFSDEPAFKAQSENSEFADQGIEIKVEMLCSILQGDEILVLNPGSEQPTRLTLHILREMTLERR